jgi:hypothetical protein
MFDHGNPKLGKNNEPQPIFLPPIKIYSHVEEWNSTQTAPNVTKPRNIVEVKTNYQKLTEECYYYEEKLKKQTMEIEKAKKRNNEQKLKLKNKRILKENIFSHCYEASDLPMMFISVDGKILSWNW